MAAEINEVFSKEALDGIKQAGVEIAEVDDRLKELTVTLLATTDALKKEGIDFKEVATQQKAASDSAKVLTDEQKRLNTIQRNLAATTDEVVTARVKASQKTKEQKERITELVNAENKEIGTLQKLKNQNKALTKERSNLNLKTKEGANRLKEINSQLDQNNSVIEKNTDKQGKQRLGIGRYTEGIKNALSQLGFMPPALEKAIAATSTLTKVGDADSVSTVIGTKFTLADTAATAADAKVTAGATKVTVADTDATKGNTAATAVAAKGKELLTAATQGTTRATKILRIALIATGIGVIVLVILALVQAFTRTEKGVNKLRVILAPLRVIFRNLGDLIGDFGELIISAFENPKAAVVGLWEVIKGQFINRINSFVKFFTGLGTILRGIWELDTDKIAKGAKDAGNAYIDAITGVEDTVDKVGDAFGRVGDFIGEIADESRILIQLEKDRLKLTQDTRKNVVEEAKIFSEIADLILLTRQADVDRGDQQAALIRAEQLQKDISATRLGLQEEALRIKKAEAAISDQDAEVLDEIADMEAELFRTRREEADKVREIVNRQVELQTKINNELKIEAAARQKIADEAAKIEFDFEEGDEEIIDDITRDPEIQAAGKRAAEIAKIAQKSVKESLAIEEIKVSELEALYEADVISFEEFQALKTEIEQIEADKRKEINDLAIEAGAEAINIGFDLFQSDLERKSQALELQRQEELANSEGDKVAQDAINEKFDKKEKEIRRKSAVAGKAQAVFNAMNATGVSVIASAQLGFPAAIPFIAAAAALGALQIAAILARPIPEFYTGGDIKTDSVVSLAERGKELIETSSGQMLLATGPTLATGLKGATVYDSAKTRRIMNSTNAGFDSPELMNEVRRGNAMVAKAIKNQTHYHFLTEMIVKHRGNYSEKYHDLKVKGIG